MRKRNYIVLCLLVMTTISCKFQDEAGEATSASTGSVVISESPVLIDEPSAVEAPLEAVVEHPVIEEPLVFQTSQEPTSTTATASDPEVSQVPTKSAKASKRDDRVQETNASRIAKPASDSSQARLPAYPWPPEAPSSRASLSTLYPEIHKLSIGSDLREISRRLSQRLNEAQYFDYGFYSVPGGFAVTTKFEAIDKLGKNLPAGKRYLSSNQVGRNHSFYEQLKQLFVAPKGFYRFIVFIVTDQPIVAVATVLTEETAAERLRNSASSLTADYRDRMYTDNHDVHALIYEFEKNSPDDELQISDPGQLGFNTHFQRSGIAMTISEPF